MKYVHSTRIKTAKELFDVFAEHKQLIIADCCFDSISQLIVASKCDDEYYHHIRAEINRLVDLQLEEQE